MKRIFAVLVLLVLLVLLVGGAQAQTVKLAAYNIENAFDVFDDPYTEDEATQVKPRVEWEAIAGAIKAIDPDVMAFEELENEHVLRAMVSEFLPDAGYDYIAAGRSNSGRGINLGIISRLPITSTTSYRFRTLRIPGSDQTWRFARDLYRVTLEAPDGKPLDVFVVHFKSRRDSDGDPKSANWRLSEALMTRRIVDAILLADPDARLVVMGDFNDELGDPAVTALIENDGLRDVHAALPEAQRITYLRDPYRSTIDYMLASPALADTLVPGSAKVIRDEKLLPGSDHAPLVASFDLSK